MHPQPQQPCDIDPADLEEHLEGAARRPYASRRTLTIAWVKGKWGVMEARRDRLYRTLKSSRKMRDSQYKHSEDRSAERCLRKQPSRQLQQMAPQHKIISTLAVEPLSQLQPPPLSQPQSQQLDINKVVAELLTQNNDHMQRVNETVMNRLLNIIENSQQALAQSRHSQQPAAYLRNSVQVSQMQRYGSVGDPGQIPEAISAKKSQPVCHVPQNNQEPVISLTSHKPTPEPSSPNITINNLFPTSTKSQPFLLSKHPSSTALELQQISLTKLENKRRQRQFAYHTPNYTRNQSTSLNVQGHIEWSEGVTPVGTPRMEGKGTVGERSGDTTVDRKCVEARVEEGAKQAEVAQVCMKKSSKCNYTDGHSISNIEIAQVQSESSEKEIREAIVQKHTVAVEQTPKIVEKPVFLEIPIDDSDGANTQNISLAEAFKKRIGKLPSRQERKQKQQQKMQKQARQKQLNASNQFLPVDYNSETNKENLKQNMQPKRPQERKNQRKNPLEVDVRSLQSKAGDGCLTTPKTVQPSEELLSRLVGGSKAKVSRKQMYSLTRKNYEKLPEVLERKKIEQRKQLQIERLERIKQYQKSIRASKTTIISNASTS